LRNHFELFGLTPAFAVDAAALDEAYRRVQAEVHPDRFAAAGDAERRASMQWTTRANEAYRTLKDPVQRAKHLLELQGIDVGFETNTQMPTGFLMQQLEMREQIEAAVGGKDSAALGSLMEMLGAQKRDLEVLLGESLDVKKDYEEAAGLTRKLMFLQKIAAEIDAAYEEVE
jgi:molecular chaperone HscB